MKMEMEQLLSMGFSSELAAQALAATSGKFTVKATEWILSQKSSNPNPNPNSNSNPSPPFQPKLDASSIFTPSFLLPILPLNPQPPPPPPPQASAPYPKTTQMTIPPPHPRSTTNVESSGKTSIANSIVNSAQERSFYRFVSLSAVTSGVKDVRDAVEFNKSQQYSFLPVSENGSIVFMGATTENPSFHLITPLLSRCRVLTLNPLKPHHVDTLLKRAVNDGEKGLSQSVGMRVDVKDEIFATTAAARVADNQLKQKGVGSELDRDFDSAARGEHCNLISALHKSMRGSDADTIYCLARMLEGEEPLYIARILISFGSQIYCRVSSHWSCTKGCSGIRRTERGSATSFKECTNQAYKELGYGKDYIYPPDNPSSSTQSYLPPSLVGYRFRVQVPRLAKSKSNTTIRVMPSFLSSQGEIHQRFLWICLPIGKRNQKYGILSWNMVSFDKVECS
ncbi:hypothetical protein F3Y22_tig00110503pilonHSYRG00198 [Hibiscus syriacus]|uniref:UBA domain-containing protein n=1 Tax=Hibiscus syriacus TaxID=106335 RepID=A0A6A3AD10_HIBSY|nr:hypothetical protein F3Y22_tig00110503pilonHSYRG00198 [Hibiscus syriacus]